MPVFSAAPPTQMEKGRGAEAICEPERHSAGERRRGWPARQKIPTLPALIGAGFELRPISCAGLRERWNSRRELPGARRKNDFPGDSAGEVGQKMIFRGISRAKSVKKWFSGRFRQRNRSENGFPGDFAGEMGQKMIFRATSRAKSLKK